MNTPNAISTWLRRVLIAVVVLFLVASVHRAYSTVPVVVDGERVTARLGTTVDEVVEEYSPAHPGDLLSATDGRVVRPGGGRRVVVLVNGRSSAQRSVAPGDELITFPGEDVVEPVLTERRTVEAEPTVIGTGPIERVLDAGEPGVEVVRFGVVSGDIVTSETVSPARPALVRRVPAEGARVVALTFDDGPWPKQTEAVLQILADKQVPATFFMLGLRVKASPKQARMVAEAGHLVGNHTYGHPHLDTLDPAGVRREIVRTNELIEDVTGVRPTWFRAPAGRADGDVYAELKRAKMRAALWTVDPQDWRDEMTAADIVASVKANVRPGAVILLHDGGGDQRETIEALPKIIDALRARGYSFVTLDELSSVKSSW